MMVNIRTYMLILLVIIVLVEFNAPAEASIRHKVIDSRFWVNRGRHQRYYNKRVFQKQYHAGAKGHKRISGRNGATNKYENLLTIVLTSVLAVKRALIRFPLIRNPPVPNWLLQYLS
ncbi:hypothetical protein HDE_06809 [Halotydeus destructor]|nr:hypothetical protein HDE_06809 [Halotydeus destructor]